MSIGEGAGGGGAGGGQPGDDGSAPPGELGVGPDAPVAPERVLLAGESLEATVGAGRGWLAVTSHRLLAFHPEADGKRFHAPSRLNVDGVEATAAGDPWLLRWTARIGIYAVIMLGAGVLARQAGLTSLLETGGTSTGPIGPIISATSTLLTVTVAGLLVGGLLGIAVALLLGGLYLWRRERTLMVELAGERSFEIPIPDEIDGDRAAQRLADALGDDLALGEG